MEDRTGFAIAVLNKIISRFNSDDNENHYHVLKAFLELMGMFRKGLKNIEQISEGLGVLFHGHLDILEELSRFTYIPNMVPENPLMEQKEKRVSSKFMVDNGGLKKSGRDKRKRDGGGGFDHQVELEETNYFQCGDYAEVGFEHFEKVKEKLCISDKDFQFLMCCSFRISRDELETGVEPIVANMVDDLPQTDAGLIKKFVHEFVGFCKYVVDHDRNLSAGRSTKEDSEEKLKQRKRRKVEKQKQRELPIGEPEKISHGCPLVSVGSKKSEEKSVGNDCLIFENCTGSNYNTRPRKRNKYDEEEFLNRFEDERLKLDILLNHLRSAIDHAEELQKLIAENTELFSKTPIDLENYFTILDLKCIQSVYAGQGVRDILGKNITVGLSDALVRMNDKRKEVLHSIKRIGVETLRCYDLSDSL